MSRYAARLPFTPRADFIVRRPRRINGTDYQPGQPLLKDGLGDGLLRKLYEQGQIDVAEPDAAAADTGGFVDAIFVDAADDVAPAAVTLPEADFEEAIQEALDSLTDEERAAIAAVAGTLLPSEEGQRPDDADPGEPEGGPLPPQGDEAPLAPPAPPPPAFTVQKVGMGGWRVIDAAGLAAGPSHKTEAAAQKAAEALTAAKAA